jgi:hypothetical protein
MRYQLMGFQFRPQTGSDLIPVDIRGTVRFGRRRSIQTDIHSVHNLTILRHFPSAFGTGCKMTLGLSN